MKYFKRFNTFYKHNRKEIDKYIETTAWKYCRIMDPDDLKQEIIYRLIKNNFLAEWDKSKSSLNTYFTTKIRGYALHTVTGYLRSKNDYTIEEEEKRLRNLKGEQTPKNPPVNYTPREEIEFDDTLLGYFATEEIDLYIKEIIEIFKKSVSPSRALIFDMYYWQGMPLKDIEKCLNKRRETKVCYNYVRGRRLSALEAMKKILTKEGTYVE